MKNILNTGENDFFIIYSPNKPFIGKQFGIPVVGRYRIEEIGIIPWYSKMDTEISNWIDSVNNIKHQKYTP